MSGPVQRAVRREIAKGRVLTTPSRSAPFTVSDINSEGLVLLLGAGEWKTPITWECLEGIVPYIRSHGGVIDIGGQHSVVGRTGTLDAYLKGCVKRTTAGWVAAVLETAGVVKIIRTRPARVQLA